jgi:putrescine transport system permease protein
MRKGPGLFLKVSMILGFAFLYAPIIILIIYSFNESKLVTVWGGFSTKWYASLWQNQGLMDAARISASVAVSASTVATVLGVMAGLTLARMPRFFGRTLFSGMVLAPLVMPDVIIGLSLLLSFIAISLDRGFLTIVIAHATFSMCYVAVVVQSRLAGFDTSVEEAAQDLGAKPATVFFRITLPLIAPAVAAGWLLSFTLSLDDLVIASFASGPGSTTLPMKIFSSVRLGVTPEINAIATILIGLVATGTVVGEWVAPTALPPEPPAVRSAAGLADSLPGQRQDQRGQGQFQRITGQEGPQPPIQHRRPALAFGVEITQPQDPWHIDDRIADQHRRRHLHDAAVPALAGQPAEHARRQHEPGQIAAGAAHHVVQPEFLGARRGEDIEPQRADQQIAQQGRNAQAHAICGADRQHHEGLHGDRNRPERNADLRRDRQRGNAQNHQGHALDHQRVAVAGQDRLAQDFL